MSRRFLSLAIGIWFFGLPRTSFASEGLNQGDIAWLLTSSAFVMIMTLPGLALFYGGLSKRKDVLNTMGMSLIAYALASILWVIYGYGMAFGEDIYGVIGNPGKFILSKLPKDLPATSASSITENLFIVFQLTFAAITVALISGAYIERMKFSAWFVFSILWFTFVYAPVAHWVWGGGFLAKLSALDFAGGTVVHINAGIAALVGVLVMGKRRMPFLMPHNLTMVILGTGLLWFGWFGFNAGSALSASGLAAQAFLNTNTAAALGAVSWLLFEWLVQGKPTLLGFASGAVAGLVAITPAAGFVNTIGAIVIGVLSGIIPYLAVTYLKPQFGYDDSLDVFGIHGVAGILGCLLTGIFADPSINNAAGLLYGNPSQLWVQLLSVVVVGAYCAIVSLIILLIIKSTLGLRVRPEDELVGLDESLHGEKGYNLHI
ncbi:MAG: ammonium transporter [Syntrophobacterales bacterium]|nr:ammonium transporter [Syntrophobacterales bacterium]